MARNPARQAHPAVEVHPGLLSDVAQLLRLAEGVGSNSFDDFESPGRMPGVNLVYKLQRDLLNNVSGIIKSRAQRRFDLR
jgi:hypothetical protein